MRGGDLKQRVNPPYFQLVGQRDLLGKSVREAFPEIEGQGFFEILDEVYRTGKPFIGNDMRIVFQDAEDMAGVQDGGSGTVAAESR